MGVQDNNTLLIQVDFEVFGHVQGNSVRLAAIAYIYVQFLCNI